MLIVEVKKQKKKKQKNKYFFCSLILPGPDLSPFLWNIWMGSNILRVPNLKKIYIFAFLIKFFDIIHNKI